MNFVEALAKYHKGKSIRRRGWCSLKLIKGENSYPYQTIYQDGSDEPTYIEAVDWADILADDWIAEDE